MRTEFRLSGSGGQGILLAGIVLSEAAIIEDLNVVQTQSYGPEARGGSSKAEVVISDTDIDYPKNTDPDFLLALTADAYKTYGPAQGGGIIIVDSSVTLDPAIKAKTVALPIIETAVKTGKEIVTNIVALGVIVGLSKIVKQESIEKAVLGRVPKGTTDLNVAALKAGFELAAQVK
ncbi:MAG: 2-oxoacid:acceptor oxidoreductase family protein [Spirochaetes bacterium]|nr:2-oxoacid:acceptor oxidoreductase family protein [Spirochaetota bacterium]